jgi:hypothetical protein
MTHASHPVIASRAAAWQSRRAKCAGLLIEQSIVKKKKFFFEKKKQKTFAPLRAMWHQRRHTPHPVMPAQAGIHAFLPFFAGAK